MQSNVNDLEAELRHQEYFFLTRIARPLSISLHQVFRFVTFQVDIGWECVVSAKVNFIDVTGCVSIHLGCKLHSRFNVPGRGSETLEEMEPVFLDRACPIGLVYVRYRFISATSVNSELGVPFGTESISM